MCEKINLLIPWDPFFFGWISGVCFFFKRHWEKNVYIWLARNIQKLSTNAFKKRSCRNIGPATSRNRTPVIIEANMQAPFDLATCHIKQIYVTNCGNETVDSESKTSEIQYRFTKIIWQFVRCRTNANPSFHRSLAKHTYSLSQWFFIQLSLLLLCHQS